MRDRRTPIQPQAISRAALETLDGLIKQATLHTPGGTLTADDMHGLYRRVASIHGCGRGDVAAWDAQRRDHAGKRVRHER